MLQVKASLTLSICCIHFMKFCTFEFFQRREKWTFHQHMFFWGDEQSKRKDKLYTQTCPPDSLARDISRTPWGQWVRWKIYDTQKKYLLQLIKWISCSFMYPSQNWVPRSTSTDMIVSRWLKPFSASTKTMMYTLWNCGSGVGGRFKGGGGNLVLTKQ